jgi:hypothetical protein
LVPPPPSFSHNLLPRLASPPAWGPQARNRDRTGDLILTKDVLYRLSYACNRRSFLKHLPPTERETGLEPATSSLEGLRSTS